MKTRFDEKEIWLNVEQRMNKITDMHTMHLLNVLAMFSTKPGSVMSMLIQDIEDGTFADSPVWSSTAQTEENMAESLANVTGMTADELTRYALTSPLGLAIKAELEHRGVCVEPALNTLTGKG